MNVVIVASHDIDLTRAIASKVASYVIVLSDENERVRERSSGVTWDDNNKISIRAPMDGGASSPVETMAANLAGEVCLDTYWVRPLRRDRAANFDRDYSLVETADRVMAFFHKDRVMEGGTGHVVQAALVRGIPVEAWTHDESGTLTSIGSDEGFDVGLEGSEWMQQRYLEWQASEVESLLWGGSAGMRGLSWHSASPAPTLVGTITGVSVNGDEIKGTIAFPPGTKLFTHAISTTTSSSPLMTSSSPQPFSLGFPRASYGVRSSG